MSFPPRVSAAAVEDLHDRLGRSRWITPAPFEPWEAGTDRAYLRELAGHWADAFDWRAVEDRLQELGSTSWGPPEARLHLLHRPGVGPAPLPLLLLHGWPSSVLEYSRVIGPLSDPAAHGGDPRDAFSVVAAALPGFGFSSAPASLADAARRRMAARMAGMMTGGLGYRRFGVHGTDTGATVAQWLAHDRPAQVAGLHMAPLLARDVFASHPGGGPEMDEYLRRVRRWQAAEGGYAAIQGTRPASLAVALGDSPAGLAAWIVEKLRAWSDCGGDLETRFPRDEVLAHISLYWFTGSIGTSMLPYYADRKLGTEPFGRVEIPTAILVTPRDITRPPPRELVESAFNVQRWTRLPSGGHFPAFEEPERFVEDLRDFFRPLR